MKNISHSGLLRIISIIFTLSAFVLVSVAAEDRSASTPDKDLETVRERVIANILITPVNEDQIEEAVSTLAPGGYWPEINYEDVSRTGWEHGVHLSNMLAMARAYVRPGNRFTGSAELKIALFSSLEFWIEHDFICENWYPNQISTPNTIINILLLMDPELTGELREGGLRIAGRANMQASGARQSGDRILIAAILGKQALFLRDAGILEEVIEIMGTDIRIVNDGPGLKPDMSFHHRNDNVPCTITYGLNPPSSFSRWALKIDGTRFSLPDASMELMVDYYLDGICRSLAFGHYRDPGAINRGNSIRGALNPIGPQVAEDLYNTSHYRRDELRNIAMIRRGEVEPDLRYTSFFWKSEYFSHQRPGWFASLRMHSERGNNFESPYNFEGLKNHHYTDGANFLTITGKEYSDIFPVWDWQRIPGTTVVQKPELPHWDQIVKKGLTGFVGGVTDNEYGAAAFDFKSPHDPLIARKSWFFFDDEYIALGSGIASTSAFPVNTTVTQRFLEGDVLTGTGKGYTRLSPGEHHLDGRTWVHHDRVAYIFPSSPSLNVKNDTSTGHWRLINLRLWATDDEISADLFTLWIDHGAGPGEGSYEYIVVPGIEPEEVGGYSKELAVRVLVNTSSLQAVRHDGLGITQIVFYEPGTIDIGNGIALSADKPCMVMVKGAGRKIDRITVLDPLRTSESLHLTIGTHISGKGDNWSVSRQGNGGSSLVRVKLPSEGLAGKSVVMDLY